MKLSIRSEYSTLKKVIVHRPGEEINKLIPTNFRDYLFEDIPFLATMQKEHDGFVEALRSQGAEVLYLRDLLIETLSSPAAKQEMVEEITYLERCEGIAEELLDRSPEAIADIFIVGLDMQEARALDFSFAKGSLLPSAHSIITPVPNSYFMRDPAAVVGDHIVCSNMYYTTRMRESLIMQLIFQRNPNFTLENSLVFGIEHDERRPYMIEGGDIIILNDKAVAIGCSERTRAESIRKLAGKLISNGICERVYEVSLPSQREYMHLDTVFTIVGPSTVVAYENALSALAETRIYEAQTTGEIKLRAEQRPFLEALHDELGGVNIVKTAGGDVKFAAREQRTDGTNLFAIAPNVVVSYDRNVLTNAALREAGVTVLEIVGSELVRGLGGPRCMTMPIERA